MWNKLSFLLATAARPPTCRETMLPTVFWTATGSSQKPEQHGPGDPGQKDERRRPNNERLPRILTLSETPVNVQQSQSAI